MSSLRELLAEGRPTVMPGAWDARSASSAGRSGLTGAYLAGSALATAQLGCADEALVSPTEVAATLRRLKEQPGPALLVDAQSGFGNQLTAHFVVRDLVAAGADGVILGDQAFPSHTLPHDRRDAGLPELLARLRAAREAAGTEDVAVIARLDGVDAYGFDEASRRVCAIAAERLADAIVIRVSDARQVQDALHLAPSCELPLGVELPHGTRGQAAKLVSAGCPVVLLPSLLLDEDIRRAGADPAATPAAAVAQGRCPSDASKPTRMREAFRSLCFDERRVSMVVAPDALTARIAESVGFKAIFSAGYGTSAVRLAKPDRGIADFGLMADNAREVINAVDIPVFVDGDTGYGDTANIARMVSVYENLGAAGLFIEDQVWPKRCGHMDGKAVVSREEGVARIAAAAEARRHDDFLIMSRTDAYATDGLDEALARTRAYHEAGADLCFIEAPKTREDMCRIPKLFGDAPLMANMIESGKTPLMSDEEIFDAGFTIAVHPCGIVYTEAYAAHRLLDDMRRHGGDVPDDLTRMIDFPRFNEFLGLERLNELERRLAEGR